MVFICLPNELFNDISVGVPEGDYVVNISFPSWWFVSAFFLDLFFTFQHENIGKSYGHLSAHGSLMCLQVDPFVELE